MRDNLDFLQKGPGTLKKLNDAVRERLHSACGVAHVAPVF
jgi:hypothetical protein